jgi:two-component system NtrC family response regulator
MSTQAKLLRVLETGEYMRIGGESVNKTDTRIVAATNVILDEAVTNRVFRQDLFFRLDVLTLKIPPLRERKEDIPYFLEYYLSRFAEGKDIVVREFSPETIKLLSDYDWPGNVREMVNLIQRLAAVVDEPVIRPLHLPDKMKNTKPPVITDLGQTVNNSLGQTANNSDPDVFRDFCFNPDLLVEKLQNQLIEEKSLDLNQVLDKLTEFRNMVARNLVKKALAETLGDRQAAALLLGITPRTLKYIYSGK